MKNKLMLSTLIIILVCSFSYLMLPTKNFKTKVLGTDADEPVFDTDASNSEHNANTTTLFPIDDATVESRYKDAKLGIWGTLSLDYSQGTGHDWSSYIIIKFDLSSIPINAEIESAKLYLHTEGQPLRYYNGASTESTQEVEAHYCPNNTWNEISLTYNSFPTTCTPEIMSGYPTDITTINGTAWFSWDITEDTKKSLGGKITEALVPSQRYEGHVSIYFFSKECDNHCENTSICAAKLPKLEITYTIP